MKIFNCSVSPFFNSKGALYSDTFSLNPSFPRSAVWPIKTDRILPVDLSAEAAEFGTLTATNLFDRACEEIRWHLRDRIRISPRSSSASPRAFAGRLRRAAPFE